MLKGKRRVNKEGRSHNIIKISSSDLHWILVVVPGEVENIKSVFETKLTLVSMTFEPLVLLLIL